MIIDAMNGALDALEEYYNEDAPVVVLLRFAIIEAAAQKAENERLKREAMNMSVDYEKN